ncbi:hypothetical protein [Streptomyces roseolus]
MVFTRRRFFDFTHCPKCFKPAPKPNPRICPTPRCGFGLNPFARR